MDVEALWRRYATCWSLPGPERVVELAVCVSDDVAYLDPQGPVTGIEDLGHYMDGFARSLPGARFEIVEVLRHHGRSLARWRLRGGGGDILQTGTSTAVHASDGRLAAITGFFDDPPAADESPSPSDNSMGQGSGPGR